MSEFHCRRARVEAPMKVPSVHGVAVDLPPGEYFAEDAGLTMRLHPDHAGTAAVAEFDMQAFDALLTQRRVVFLSWN
jgi:hypothetical protein